MHAFYMHHTVGGEGFRFHGGSRDGRKHFENFDGGSRWRPFGGVLARWIVENWRALSRREEEKKSGGEWR
jgi:hypothetical protein